MSVGFDASGFTDSAGVAQTNWNITPITVGSGTNRFLAVYCYFDTGTGNLPSGLSVSWNGVAMSQIAGTQLDQATDAFTFAQTAVWFGLVAPASGNNTLNVSVSSGVIMTVGAISFTGVNQSSPTQNGGIIFGSSASSPTITINSAVGDMTVAAFLGGQSISSTSAVQDWIDNNSAQQVCTNASCHAAGSSPSNTMTVNFGTAGAYMGTGFDVVAGSAPSFTTIGIGGSEW